MPSIREQILAALLARLETVPGATAKREAPLPETVPAGGLIILRDGDPGDPEVVLSPVTYLWEHQAEIEIILQRGQDDDSAVLDTLLMAVGNALAADRSLGGLAEGLDWGAPKTSGLAIEIGHAQLAAPKFFRHGGAKLDKLSFDMARSGAANASIAVIAQGETETPAAIDATPATFALKRFSQGCGAIRVGGGQLANVVGGKLSFSNNLERVETIRADGLIDGVDETEATAEGSVDIRFGTDTTLTAAIAAESPVTMEYGFTIPGSAFALTFHLPRVFLPKKKQEIKGPGGIQASYDWRAARDPVAGYLLRVTLVNDVAGY